MSLTVLLNGSADYDTHSFAVQYVGGVLEAWPSLLQHQYEHFAMLRTAHFDVFAQAKEVSILAESMQICLSRVRPPMIGRPGHMCALTSVVAGCRLVNCPPRPVLECTIDNYLFASGMDRNDLLNIRENQIYLHSQDDVAISS